MSSYRIAYTIYKINDKVRTKYYVPLQVKNLMKKIARHQSTEFELAPRETYTSGDHKTPFQLPHQKANS